MDPMEDVQMNGPMNSAHQYQCQRPQPPSAGPAFSPSRGNQHYDPVHDSDIWPRNNRPSYLPPDVHWQPGSYMPIPHWPTYGDAQYSTTHNGGSSGFRGSRGYMDLPAGSWNDYSGMGSGYNPHGGPYGSGAAAEPDYGLGNSQNSAPSIPSLYPGYNIHGRQQDTWTQLPYLGRPPAFTSPQRRSDENAPERAPRQHQPMPPVDNHRWSTNGSAARRAYRARGHPEASWGGSYGSPPSASTRRLAAQLSIEAASDDEDDEEISEHRRQAEMLFAEDEDYDRSLAAVRGALATGKKVTSRAFIRELETVPIEDLSEGEKNCSICYEAIGTANPEGLTEKAVRLPNCKHVFGDICIKKWCEDSDTCPYCRDKLPSELSVRAKLVAQARTSVQRVQLIRAQSRANAQLQEMATRRAEREANAGSLFDGPPSFDRAREPYQPSTPHRTRDDIQRRRLRAPTLDDDYPGNDMTFASYDEGWGASPPIESLRSSDSVRRRANRGRLGNGMRTHMQRPTSGSGSSRYANPNTNPQNNSQRAQVLNNSFPQSFGSLPQFPRSVTPGFSGSDNGSNTATAGTEVESRPEEVSPPVAVGSGASRNNDSARPSFEFLPVSQLDWAAERSRSSNLETGNSTLGSPFQESARSRHTREMENRSLPRLQRESDEDFSPHNMASQVESTSRNANARWSQ